jgi:hypothetical protein
MNKEQAKFGEVSPKMEGATLCRYCYCNIRKPLTDEEIEVLLKALLPDAVRLPPGWLNFARAIERAHGIGEEK